MASNTTKFGPQTCERILARVELGASLADAARAAGVNPETASSWLTKGRKQGEGRYWDFAQALERARAAGENQAGPMGEDEHLLVVSQAARAGNVQAMRLLWEMLVVKQARGSGDVGADPLAELDELAERRAAKPKP